jgi:hypothetical protein
MLSDVGKSGRPIARHYTGIKRRGSSAVSRVHEVHEVHGFTRFVRTAFEFAARGISFTRIGFSMRAVQDQQIQREQAREEYAMLVLADSKGRRI